jgi:DNA polymerase I-like protein with 3'-5' exonuclease and polymerase domains
LIGQIHDSIIIDVHPDELNRVMRVVQRVTCEDLPRAWKWIIVPLEIEAELSTVDDSWAEKEEVKFEDY